MAEPTTLLHLLVDPAFKSTALLAAVALASLALRHAAARNRQLLWAAGLIGAAALPLLAPMLPAWHLPLLSPLMTTVSSSEPAHALAAASRDASPQNPSNLGSLGEPAPVLQAVAFGGLDGEDSTTLPLAARIRTHLASAVPTLFLLWVLGAILLGLRAAVGHLAAWRLGRQAEATRNPLWLADLEGCRRQIGLRRAVTLGFHPRAATPMTWGLRRPIILLPAAAASWDTERRRVVLLHELLHVRRNDWLLRSVAHTACALYWFNPLAWFALRRLTVEQEQACDDGVLALGTPPSRYADHLLAIARAAIRPRISIPTVKVAVVEMAATSPLEARLMSILSFSRRPPHTRRRWLPVVLVLALIPTLAALRLWAAPDVMGDAADQGDSASAHVTQAANSQALRATLAELEAIEQRLQPFEDELAAIETELEPFEHQLEAAEHNFKPSEEEMAAIEARFGPHEERMEALERELRPYEDRMEAIERQMRPFEERMAAIDRSDDRNDALADEIERQAEPLHARLEELSAQMEPLAEEMQRAYEEARARAGEPVDPNVEETVEQVARMHARYQSDLEAANADAARQMEAIHQEMQRVQQQLEPIHHRMREAHRQTEPEHQKMQDIHREMEPLHQQMQQIHQEMEPLHQRMQQIQQEMEPLHREMASFHEQMEPMHEQMHQVHQQMEPVHRRMEEVHERMRPVHEEMERVHEKLMAELRSSLRSILAEETAGLGINDSMLNTAADRMASMVSVHTNDGRLSVRASQPRLRQELTTTLGSPTPHSPLAEAIQRSARAISNLEILYDQN